MGDLNNIEDPFTSDGFFLDNLQPDPQSETANWLNMSDILNADSKTDYDDFDNFFKEKILPTQSSSDVLNSLIGGDLNQDLNFYENEEASSFLNRNFNSQTQMASDSPMKFLNRKTVLTKPADERLIQLNQNESLNAIVKLKSQINAPNLEKQLRPVEELPHPYRNIFSQFPYFNYVQSKVFDDVVYSDRNMVICAPTSSGKTVILELAIVRLLISINYQKNQNQKFKIIYLAPLKALCTEKFNEWNEKFEQLHNLKCLELTGDTDLENETDLKYIENASIICTTPEKWDFMTRKWKNRHSIMHSVKLFLIDEIHVLGENSRGAIIEAVVSRMKTSCAQDLTSTSSHLRFVAISATIPNIDDIALWLSDDILHQKPAIVYKLNETYRPVKLNKVVLGYFCSSTMSDFCFDLSLSYKIAQVIDAYSNSKPTLIFCSTRKGTQQTAEILSNNKKYIKNAEHNKVLLEFGGKLKDPKLRALITNNGIGYHHAGLDTNDRHLIENLFLTGNLLVLFCTSTLSIGINLPAHLVIIKSTMFYSTNQAFIDYSTSQILQMIGRAGRPQFDKTATAVIMTKMNDKSKYESLLEGTQFIESHLHHSLIEHLNVEIVLRTIANLKTAVNWLKSTFLYVRIRKNPEYYGIKISQPLAKSTDESDFSKSDEYLSELCIRNLNLLMSADLIEKCDFVKNAELKPTRNGYLMARYCLAFETMKAIISNLSTEQKEADLVEVSDDSTEHSKTSKSLEDLLNLIASSKELDDMKLRSNEKSILNNLNNNGKIPKSQAGTVALAKKPNTVRYILNGKVKNNSMKINILIQAQLGSIQLNDFSLSQDIFRIFRIGQRISRCILEYCLLNLSQTSNNCFKTYETFINTVVLYKCFITRLWHDSPHLFKQFNRIGAALSQALLNADIDSFDKILETHPRHLEKVLNKNPPFGNQIIETIQKLPKFKIEFELIERKENKQSNKTKLKNETSLIMLDINCVMTNYGFLNECENGGCLGYSNPVMFIIGDEKNNLICAQRLSNSTFLQKNGVWNKRFYLNRKKNGCFVHASLVLLQFVGLDIHESIQIFQEELNADEEKTCDNDSKSKYFNNDEEANENLDETKNCDENEIYDNESNSIPSRVNISPKNKKRKFSNLAETSPKKKLKEFNNNNNKKLPDKPIVKESKIVKNFEKQQKKSVKFSVESEKSNQIENLTTSFKIKNSSVINKKENTLEKKLSYFERKPDEQRTFKFKRNDEKSDEKPQVKSASSLTAKNRIDYYFAPKKSDAENQKNSIVKQEKNANFNLNTDLYGLFESEKEVTNDESDENDFLPPGIGYDSLHDYLINEFDKHLAEPIDFDSIQDESPSQVVPETNQDTLNFDKNKKNAVFNSGAEMNRKTHQVFETSFKYSSIKNKNSGIFLKKF